MILDFIDNMFLVAAYTEQWYGGNVEGFSSTQGGKVELIYVYGNASEIERAVAMKKAKELSIPCIVSYT